jgi:DNA-binding NarL/FixJ family response regulator
LRAADALDSLLVLDDDPEGPAELPSMTIRALIVDDQALVRAGFRMILGSQPDLEVIAEAADGNEAVRMAQQMLPDVVLMDIRMPNLDGLAATRVITAMDARRPVRVVILTTYELDEYVFEALAAGASGFLLKDVRPEDLINGVRLVAAGEALLAPSVTRRLISEFARRRPPAETQAASLDLLTSREREVLELIARGQSNAEIAESLFLSENTVKTHVAHILEKLDLRDRVQAVIYAYETGVVPRGLSR